MSKPFSLWGGFFMDTLLWGEGASLKCLTCHDEMKCLDRFPLPRHFNSDDISFSTQEKSEKMCEWVAKWILLHENYIMISFLKVWKIMTRVMDTYHLCLFACFLLPCTFSDKTLFQKRNQMCALYIFFLVKENNHVFIMAQTMNDVTWLMWHLYMTSFYFLYQKILYEKNVLLPVTLLPRRWENVYTFELHISIAISHNLTRRKENHMCSVHITKHN